MLMAVKNYFRFFKESLKCNMASLLEYKKSFLIQSIFMFVNNGFFLIFWSVLFNASGGDIKGVNMGDILYLWSLPTLSFGIAFFFFGGINKLGKHILEGGLDTYLVQPKNVMINVMLSGMDFSACGDLVYGLVIGLFATGFNFGKYMLLLAYGLVGAIFFVCAEALIRLITVWVGNTDYVEHIYMITMTVNFSTYPEAIYNNFIKILIYTIIPSGYIAFMPIKLIEVFNLKLFGVYLLAVCGFVGITAILSKIMLKKYESGNSMAMRG